MGLPSKFVDFVREVRTRLSTAWTHCTTTKIHLRYYRKYEQFKTMIVTALTISFISAYLVRPSSFDPKQTPTIKQHIQDKASAPQAALRHYTAQNPCACMSALRSTTTSTHSCQD